MEIKPFILAGKESHTDKEPLVVNNPFSGEIVSKVFTASSKEYEEAFAAAERAKPVMEKLSLHMRAEILLAASEELHKRAEEFAALISAEAGKPIGLAKGEVSRAIGNLIYASEEAKRIGGEVIRLDSEKGNDDNFAITRLFPAGAVYAITPFNFPLNLVVHKVAPAIAAGNSCILKPSSKTPLTALEFGKILLKAGLPPEGISILPSSSQTAQSFVSDKRTNILTFTGSADVGWLLRDMASYKRVILELGGNAACIVDKDSDIDYAVTRCVYGAFAYSGQICISLQRLFVEESIFDQFTEKLLAETKILKMGNPINKNTDIGPMIDESAAIRVENIVGQAVARGAKLLCGGKRRNSLYEPTILTDVKPAMYVCSEEIFAPVVIVEKYSDFEDAISRVNNSKYGLHAGIFSNNLDKVLFAFENLKVGGVVANDVPTFRADIAPYGGVKDSGLGREGVKYAIAEMSEIRTLIFKRT
ncbi:MAG: aldehyde dehydrogenase family protein [Planctomycetota bacterium]